MSDSMSPVRQAVIAMTMGESLDGGIPLPVDSGGDDQPRQKRMPQRLHSHVTDTAPNKVVCEKCGHINGVCLLTPSSMISPANKRKKVSKEQVDYKENPLAQVLETKIQHGEQTATARKVIMKKITAKPDVGLMQSMMTRMGGMKK